MEWDLGVGLGGGMGLGMVSQAPFNLLPASRPLVSSPFGWRLGTKRKQGRWCRKLVGVELVGGTLYFAQVLGHVT